MGNAQKKWYDYKVLNYLLLTLIFPVGLCALWKSNVLAKWWKIIAMIFTVPLILIGCYGQHGKTDSAWQLRNLLVGLTLKIVPWKKLSKTFGEMTSRDKKVKDYVAECLLVTGRDT